MTILTLHKIRVPTGVPQDLNNLKIHNIEIKGQSTSSRFWSISNLHFSLPSSIARKNNKSNQHLLKKEQEISRYMLK